MSAATDTAGAPPRPASPRRSLSRRVLARPETGTLIGALAVYVLFYAVAPTFRQLDSLSTVLYQSSTLGIVGLAVALLMIGGEFDLSAGVAVTSSALTASMVAFQFTLNVWSGVLVALVLSLAIGAFNGILLVVTRLPSFLVTLGTFLMLQGLNLALTKAITGNVATDSIRDMDGFEQARDVFASTISVGDTTIRVTVLWWAGFAVLATWVLLRTKYGNWIFAAGGGPESARAVGVPVAFVKISLFTLVGFAAWFVGMHQLFAFNTVQSGEGVGRELLYIAAAVIGGCLLTGGYGSIAGPFIGAFLFGMVQQGIVYADWDPDWFMFFLGAMLLLATLLNLYVRKQATRR
ncbi:ABC transporter permease [Streptomyces litchfieldiae]|uniref:Xylose transport system permease protein XylH n=1 Tax=Streptomyces litchfieldiae TaxID=3075543 RepID=A0ABU2MMU3_9ACTN|nr:ABC transporter permease [Streptomyces sp. DSM 44938]MDT0342933.1 ABC transporter permease [Streptomyces sp. DSM 44938]